LLKGILALSVGDNTIGFSKIEFSQPVRPVPLGNRKGKDLTEQGVENKGS
jgi:hypothetical protein